MKHYKLREGESIRKPQVKRDRVEIRVPVLLLCLAMAFLVWLYIVSFSEIDPTDPLDDLTETTAAAEETSAALDGGSAPNLL
jgi:hypothetical protein